MDKSLGYLRELIESVQSQIVEHGPQAWDVILSVERIDAIGNILGGLLLFLGPLLFIYYMWGWVVEKRENIGYDFEFIFDLACAVVTALLLIVIVSGLIPLLDIWNWIAIFNPELSVAHDVIENIK